MLFVLPEVCVHVHVCVGVRVYYGGWTRVLLLAPFDVTSRGWGSGQGDGNVLGD